MNLRERNALIWMISITGIVLVLFLDVLLIPPAIQRYRQLWTSISQVTGQSTDEFAVARIASDVQQAAVLFRQDLARIRGDLEKARFEARDEAEIPAFIENLQSLFSGPGLNLQQIAYQSKVRENGFLTFPFIATVEATYAGLRNLIEAILAHPAAIHIDHLEFLRLTDETHHVRIRIRCSARFRTRA